MHFEFTAMTPEQINQFFSFLYQGRVGEIVFWLRLFSGVITSALAAVLVVILMKFRQLIGARPPAPREAEMAEIEKPENKQWQEVMKKINSPNPSDWNLAVIQADSIVDEMLKSMAPFGATMGDRLKQLDRSKLGSLDSLWEAHKIRNRIAHDTDQVLDYQESRRAIMLFSEVLRELNYLQE